MSKLISTAAVALAALTTLHEANAQTIYYSRAQDNSIWMANQDGTGAPSLLYANATESEATGMDMDASGNLYWGSGNGDFYWTAPADGSGVPTEIPNSDRTGMCCEALDIAVDEAGGRYFVARDNDGAGWGPLDGSAILTSYGLLYDVIGLDYDATNDRLFLSEQAGSIHSLDPNTLADTVVAAAVEPRGIVYAASTDMVYWVDRDATAGPGVWSAPADGSGTATRLFDAVGPYRIQIDEAAGVLYWTEFDGGSSSTNGRIMIGNADGSGSPTALFEGTDLAGIRGIVIGEGPPMGPLFSITGTCPVGATFSATGLTPGARFAMIRSGGTGTGAVPSGPCQGTVSGLDPSTAALVGYFRASPTGTFSVSPPTLPASACGATVQLLDVATCTFSNVATVP